MFIVASGPSELHALIDLEAHLDGLADNGRKPHARVLAVSESCGHWSVLAVVPVGQEGEKR